MCIIIVKPAGIMFPETNELKICDKNNHDGMGFMMPINGMVRIEKGFLDVDSMVNRIKKNCKKFKLDIVKIPIIYHFRLATHGEKSASTCHPFPLSAKKNELKQTNINCSCGLVHNGVLHLVDKNNPDLSDSQIFIRDYLSPFTFKDLQTDKVSNIINFALDSSKFVAMNGKGEIHYLGDNEDWYVHKERFYSNETYKQEKYVWNSYNWKTNAYDSAMYDSAYGDYKYPKINQCDLCGANSQLTRHYEDGTTYDVCKQCLDYLTTSNNSLLGGIHD